MTASSENTAGTLKQARFFLEAMALRLGLLIIPRLPRPALRALAAGAGSIAYAFCRKLRRIALANLDIAFGKHKSKAELREIARKSFLSAAMVVLDFLWFTRNTAARMANHVVVDNSYGDELGSSAFIGVTAHFGNWELISTATAATGTRHVAVFAELKNPYVTPFLKKLRNAEGVATIRRQGAIRGMLKALRKGECVALLLDQNVLPSDGGLFVDFFGLPAPMSRAAGLLSEKTGASVIVCFCMLLPNGNYRVYSPTKLAPSRNDQRELNRQGREDDAVVTTRSIAKTFETEIALHPEQWLWMYKRWKFIAPGMPREAYPFYSRPP